MSDLAEKLMGFASKYNKDAEIFYKNYNDMKEANTKKADKYFHAKANCESAQNGGRALPINISIGRELVDGLYNNPIRKGIPLKENILDCLDDLYADFYGLGSGLLYPNTDCRELIQDYRPNGLDKMY